VLRLLRMHGWVALVLLAGTAATAPAQDAGRAVPKLEATALDQRIESLTERAGQGVQATAWLGGPSGSSWYARQADRAMPTASSIKTYFLVEFFATRKDSLDQPVPGADAFLDDDDHPGFSHFSPAQRQEIRRSLKGVSARTLGKIMMGSEPAPNAVYNAAANLITAILGGPEALTKRIHARDAAFSTVFVRRYMLRDRKENGDNEATAEALAALYQKLATRQLSGIDGDTIDAIRGGLVQAGTPQTGIIYRKGGSLDSNPLTRVDAGWKETPQGPVVFVVMTSRTLDDNHPEPSKAADALGTTCTSIRQSLIEAVNR
jgi:hypothetical protein